MSITCWGAARRAACVLLMFVATCLLSLSGCGSNISQINDAAIKASAKPTGLSSLQHEPGAALSAPDSLGSGSPTLITPMPPPGTAAVEDKQDYLIGSDDLLEISFFEIEDLNQSKVVEARVGSDGQVMLPLLGNVRASGLTTGQLRQEIAEQLGERYVIDPQVSVAVKEYRSKKVLVMGEVHHPGTYLLRENRTTLMDVLSMAGGPTENVGEVLFLVRPTHSSSGESPGGQGEAKTCVETIDLATFMENGDGGSNLIVNDGDLVHVPKAGMVYVTGEVAQPGGFPVRKKLTALQAVSLSGGLKRNARADAVRLIRRTGSAKEIRTIDLVGISQGRTEDVRLKEDDVLEVPVDGMAKLGHGFLGFFGNIFNVGFALNK